MRGRCDYKTILWPGGQAAGVQDTVCQPLIEEMVLFLFVCLYFLSFLAAGLQIYPVIYDLVELSKPEYYAEYATGNSTPRGLLNSAVILPFSDRKQPSNLERAMSRQILYGGSTTSALP